MYVEQQLSIKIKVYAVNVVHFTVQRQMRLWRKLQYKP